MLRIVTYLGIFFVARVMAGAAHVLRGHVGRKVREYELRLLYRIRSRGPGGFDDAVQITLMKNAKAYAVPVTELLVQSSPGSLEEEIGLLFVESVRSPDVDGKLKTFAARHPHADTRALVEDILATKPRATTAP